MALCHAHACKPAAIGAYRCAMMHDLSSQSHQCLFGVKIAVCVLPGPFQGGKQGKGHTSEICSLVRNSDQDPVYFLQEKMILNRGSGKVKGFIHDPRSNLQVKIAIRLGSGPVTKRPEFYASSLLVLRSQQQKHKCQEKCTYKNKSVSRKFKILSSSSLGFDGVDHQFIMLYEGRLKQS